MIAHKYVKRSVKCLQSAKLKSNIFAVEKRWGKRTNGLTQRYNRLVKT